MSNLLVDCAQLGYSQGGRRGDQGFLDGGEVEFDRSAIGGGIDVDFRHFEEGIREPVVKKSSGATRARGGWKSFGAGGQSVVDVGGVGDDLVVFSGTKFVDISRGRGGGNFAKYHQAPTNPTPELLEPWRGFQTPFSR